jgi:hypothetical protein
LARFRRFDTDSGEQINELGLTAEAAKEKLVLSTGADEQGRLVVVVQRALRPPATVPGQHLVAALRQALGVVSRAEPSPLGVTETHGNQGRDEAECLPASLALVAKSDRPAEAGSVSVRLTSCGQRFALRMFRYRTN